MYRIMQILTIVLAIQLALPSAWANDDAKTLRLTLSNDVATTFKSPANNPPVDDPWDLVFQSYVSLTCNDNQILGCEFADDHFYVTGGNNQGSPNKVYVLDPEGNYVTEFDQPDSSVWGWRDLVYDGTYFYGSESTIIEAFDFEGNLIPSQNINGPLDPNRALAYDPVLDHFWTVSFSSPLYEIDRNGNVIWTGSSGLSSVYGAAWDAAAPDGPWLWLFDQGGVPQITLHQFDPLNYQPTGFSYPIQLIAGSYIAGGLAFTEEWDPAYHVFCCIGQGTPTDVLLCLEMYPVMIPQIAVTLTPVDPPIIIPVNGGSFDYIVEIENIDSAAVTFDTWIEAVFPNGSVLSPVILREDLTLPLGGVLTRQMTQVVPSPAPYGTYTYRCNAGDYPDLILAVGEFTFWKAG